MTEKDAEAPGLARLAALIADETRAACLLALLDGRAWTAGELARHAGVAASTASEHLGKLVAGGLLAEERQGRHRYVRLADERVAQLVEDLAAQVAPEAVGRRPRTLRAASAGSALARGRTCYDHLAGRLGIALTDALTGRGLLRQDTGFALTDAGLGWFEAAGIALRPTGRRPLARACLDWTERRPHLAGVAGAALCRHALDTGWCVRIGSGRAVKVTATGERALSGLLGIEVAALRG
ncbi:winged helix-turn-helix domain-containing protein [Streptomyces olivaceus]|uniref:ArsR/SmtB family transcription factor n=1 Tax=Streptomyces olivaceus TaxID=47716 RepID=UPI001CCA8AF2|nr:winged helix-turn-helix domain-containing protein [Streptomyces olivaceus]MBZ6288208.1 winged helix-turn-helix domain-containing protein [Streptomyces olivaceus]MBZ6290036.1 winged helix-turn-helix domain-containing protein [Streptomyces olivaceus]MBZ6323988.1 winged helix-turn-helix domain-containing protein [Streptomyces olivaceus]